MYSLYCLNPCSQYFVEKLIGNTSTPSSFVIHNASCWLSCAAKGDSALFVCACGLVVNNQKH